MHRYLLRRVLQAIVVLVLVSLVGFSVLHLAPGGPAAIYAMTPTMSAEDLDRLTRELGLDRPVPEQYARWVGGVLTFGEVGRGPSLSVTMRDERCSMVNFDPDSARQGAEVLKAIVRVRDNKAGVYGTVTRRGRLVVGQPILFEPGAEHRDHL